MDEQLAEKKMESNLTKTSPLFTFEQQDYHTGYTPESSRLRKLKPDEGKR
jgi:hypothetical protein